MDLSLKFKTHVQKSLEEGRHVGTIVKIASKEIDNRERTAKVPYLDVFVKVGDMEMKIGCSPSIGRDGKGNPTTRLAKLLVACGVDINSDEVDVNRIVGKKISFVTANEEGKSGGSFARIQENTIQKA